MGGPNFGGGLGHLVCTLVGIWLHSSFGPGTSQGEAVQKAADLAGEKCLKHCQVDCSQYTLDQNIKVQVSFGLTLFSVFGWFLVVLYHWCGGGRRSFAPITPASEDSSPSGAEERRSLALSQLAEVRARGRRDVLTQ